jgi:rubrerythrin
MGDECLIRDLLSKEEDAVSSYVNAAEKVSNLDVRKVLLDISKEEAVHKGELIELLKIIGVSDCAEIKQGQEEAANTIMSEELIQEKIDANMSTSEIIKEIMNSFDKTGKIGSSSPDNKKEAMKQAAAIAYETKRNK